LKAWFIVLFLVSKIRLKMANGRLSSLSTLIIFVATVTICVSFSAYSDDPGKSQRNADLKDVPVWVKRGTATLKSTEGRVFAGVGSAPVMGSVSVQISLADDHARAEVSKILTAYLEALSSEAHTSPVSGKAAKSAPDPSASGNRIGKLTREYFGDIPVIDHWRDMNNGVVYAMAELTLEQVKQTLTQAKAVDQGLKKLVTKKGDTIFDRIMEGKKE
jgi:hypothetical protein